GQVAPGGHAAKVEQKDDRQPAAVAAQQMTASAASGSSITAEAPKPLPYEPSDSDVEPEFITGLRSREPAAVPQSKSVRIALDRLDSMMNVVGELVINRTRMLGRLAELERLADVLNFSKGRMSDKIGEFQEKHEFNRIVGSFASYSPGAHAGSNRDSGDASEFSELEMDRYDDYNILSRSLTEISADVTEVL